mmetsp:Transcript_38717/g.96230  ORF Transcript_38717/g.96230 Transcript_38717/m.96230 type:complete len:121 (-) Transcript_38717:154-516(-)
MPRQDDTDQHVRLSSQEVQAVMGRLSLQVEGWRSAESLTTARAGWSVFSLECRKAVAVIEERTDTVCAVCRSTPVCLSPNPGQPSRHTTHASLLVTLPYRDDCWARGLVHSERVFFDLLT